MRADENFLRDVFRFVGIGREHERPPEYGGLVSRHERCKRRVIASRGQRSQLRIDHVRFPLTMRRARRQTRFLKSAFA
jgi:hypothetical protein